MFQQGNGVLGSDGNELTIPRRPTTEIVSGFHLGVRRQLQHATDIEAVDEGRRRLSAWSSYVTKREQRVEIQAAERWCEIRIGALLGPGERGNPKVTGKSNSPASEIGKDDRHKFRLLHEHEGIVAPLILDGSAVSRAKLLAAIKEATTKPPKPIRGMKGTAVYSVLLADPPWRYEFAEADRRNIEKEYPTMGVDAICSLDVPAAENSVLYLWGTAPKLPEALRVMEAWGFNYKTCAVWDKVKLGMGYWFRGQHELLLVGTRGKFSPPAPKHRVSSVVRAARGKHSAKPVAVYELIEAAFPSRDKVELFARVTRNGWASWGNEAGDA